MEWFGLSVTVLLLGLVALDCLWGWPKRTARELRRKRVCGGIGRSAVAWFPEEW